MPQPTCDPTAFDTREQAWPALNATTVHLWLLPFQAGDSSLPALSQCIARYCGIQPERVHVERDAKGKPWLRDPACDLRFSASHSGEQLALAFLRSPSDRDLVGVDLEMRKPRPRTLELARRFFARSEADALAALPAEQREAAFYRYWVGKEAVLKAMGRGLAHGLDKVVFSLSATAGDPQKTRTQLRLTELMMQIASDPARTKRVPPERATSSVQATSPLASGADVWSLHEFVADPAVGCIAWKGASRHVISFRLRKSLNAC